ncbi:MAG: hypothetical protein ACLQC7_07425 [Thermoplasmata archaeon]
MDPDRGALGPAAPPGPRRCPLCGGTLGPPFSGDVHCFVECGSCEERFELDDPRLADPGG